MTKETNAIRGQVSEHYRGGRGHKYSARQSRNSSGMGVVEARKFASYISSEDVVLDFGCGIGDTLAAIPCLRRLGVEPNPFSAAACIERGIEVFERIGLVREASIHVVISNHALEHCLEPYEELREIRRVLKAGGRFILVTPIDDWRSEKHVDSADFDHHLYTWTPLILGNLLAEAGFAVERIQILTHAWPPKARGLWRSSPEWLFDATCTAWSALRRRRQLRAVCRAGSSSGTTVAAARGTTQSLSTTGDRGPNSVDGSGDER
jgi:SAM-dependent methyltransferase